MRAVLDETLRACNGRALTERALSETPLTDSRYHLLAIGKAAASMASAVRALLGSLIKRSLLIVPDGVPVPDQLPGAIVQRAGHPLPDARSVEAGEAVLGFVGQLSASDRLIVALSGGGSALLCAPAEGISLETLQQTNEALLHHPLAIHEINAVRKHLSRVKGGRLALATRANVTVLALSDIPSGELSALASGPFATDPTSFADALAVAESVAAPDAVLDYLRRGCAGELEETPKVGDDRLHHVRTVIVGTPLTLRNEARGALERDGFTVQDLPIVAGTRIEEVAHRYADIAHQVRATDEPRAWIAVGEPSLTIQSSAGKGGRNTHLALLVARELRDVTGACFLSAGSDGVDGNTEVAGAVVDPHTWTKERTAARALDELDSATYLEKIGATIETGPTATNLTDLHVLAMWHNSNS